jgi:hypothetical protein
MACFIKTQFFGQEFWTFTDDGSMKPYNDKLASLHSQFRQFGRILVPLHPSNEKVTRYGKNSNHQREHFRQMDEERGKAAKTS